MSTLPHTPPRAAAGGGGATTPDRSDGGEFRARYLRLGDARCGSCGFRLSGLRRPECPDCGHEHTIMELSAQARHETAPWYLVAGWGLVVAAVLGLPVGIALLGAAASSGAAGRSGAAVAAVAGAAMAMGLPLAAGAWLRRSGARMHGSSVGARWVVSLACWAPSLPLVLMGGRLAAGLMDM